MASVSAQASSDDVNQLRDLLDVYGLGGSRRCGSLGSDALRRVLSADPVRWNANAQMVWVAHVINSKTHGGLTSARSRCMTVDLGAHWPMKRDRLMKRRELSNLVITEVVVVLIGRQP